MRIEIRISGFGGQGVGLAGSILGKAIAIHDGREAVMTQAYGPEARGGASSANIVAADRPIDYPFVQHPDILVALSQEAYTKFRPDARPKALILIDDDLVNPFDEDRPFGIPATRLAEELGQRIVTNMVMLGFFTAVTDVVSRAAMEEAIKSSVKDKFVELNLSAFTIGFEFHRSGYTHE
ncbi:MAG: hypothetical protein FJ010_11660 [Chloroflexi bacterium]|nr:hypothetical protein [Chloroflexota bacterium]